MIVDDESSLAACLLANQGQGFVSQVIATQTGTFRATFDASVSLTATDVVIGLSNGPATVFSNYATTARFFSNNLIDTFNGTVYTAAQSIGYLPNTNYHFRMEVSVPMHRFSLFVTGPTGGEKLVADNFPFRTQQAGVVQIDRLDLIVDAVGTAQVCNVVISQAAPIDTTAPTVVVTSPSVAATLSGTLALTATASDNIGVSGVQFLVDGSAAGAEDIAAPYSASLNTATLSNGTHVFSARARDAAGNAQLSSGISATVSNAAPPPPPPSNIALTLTRASGVTGVQRVNVGVPLAKGALSDESLAAVRINGSVVPTARRALARYSDGSIRSLQLQFDADTAITQAIVAFGVTAPSLPVQAVDGLLRTEALGGSTVQTPRVWVTMPSSSLVQSTVAGHLISAAQLPAGARQAWSRICDYAAWGSSAFTPTMNTDRAVWLYDRGTAFYRGYAVTGSLSVLQTAYRETDLYRRRILVLDGAALPQSASADIKYNYTQNMALHYLLSGDDRFREAAEAVADRSPISGFTASISSGQWTERHSGFGLLANVYAARVSDDKAATYRARATTIMNNLIAVQDRTIDFSASPPEKQLGLDSRCFSHTPQQHDISEYDPADLDGPPGSFVCSPWMSAIAADGIEAYADDGTAAQRSAALNSLVRLGRRLGKTDNRGPSGRPHYLFGVDGGDHPDDFDEHWGEVAQITAMSYFYAGANDATLRTNAEHYLNGFSANGEIGQVRSFNWQCRSAISTPAYLP